jgi:hypothetical protein
MKVSNGTRVRDKVVAHHGGWGLQSVPTPRLPIVRMSEISVSATMMVPSALSQSRQMLTGRQTVIVARDLRPEHDVLRGVRARQTRRQTAPQLAAAA